MARFMSGNCDFKTNWKIVFSMPKIPFIISFFKILFKKNKRLQPYEIIRKQITLHYDGY